MSRTVHSHKKITNKTDEIREDANQDNVKTTQRIQLTDYFPKNERIFSHNTNYVVIARDSTFCKYLMNS